MNRIAKKLLVIFAVVGVTIGSAGAVMAKGNPEHRIERLAEKLELTPAQKAKVGKIFADRHAKAEVIKDNEALSKGERKEQLQALRAGGKAEIAQILTSEQKTKFAQMKEDRKDRRHGKRGDFKKGMEELGLSGAQKTQMKSIRGDSKQEKEAILEAHEGDREAARPELKDHREKTRTKIRAILTAEQQTKFDAMKKEHMGKRGERGKKG
jgi:Spy/CpxP family protein refolding chaperone